MTISLPTPESESGKNEWSDVYANDNKLKEELEATQAEVAAISGVTWYTPKVIATEESRTNTAFGTLTTADEIKSVALPENGLIVIGYAALAKSSVASAGKPALFLSANQLKAEGIAQEALVTGTGWRHIHSEAGGLIQASAAETAFATTGEAVGVGSTGGLCVVFAAAGTYNISVQWKATSGSVTAKERKLWVAVLG